MNPHQKQISLSLAGWIRDKHELNIYWDPLLKSQVTGSVLGFSWHTLSVHEMRGDTQGMQLFFFFPSFLPFAPSVTLTLQFIFKEASLDGIANFKINVYTRISTIKRKDTEFI